MMISILLRQEAGKVMLIASFFFAKAMGKKNKDRGRTAHQGPYFASQVDYHR